MLHGHTLDMCAQVDTLLLGGLAVPKPWQAVAWAHAEVVAVSADGKLSLKTACGSSMTVANNSWRVCQSGTHTVQVAFGFNTETPSRTSRSRTGVCIYWKGRLVMPYHRLESQSLSCSFLKGTNAVIDVHHLQPAHTKQSFMDSQGQYNHMLSWLNKQFRNFWTATVAAPGLNKNSDSTTRIWNKIQRAVSKQQYHWLWCHECRHWRRVPISCRSKTHCVSPCATKDESLDEVLISQLNRKLEVETARAKLKIEIKQEHEQAQHPCPVAEPLPEDFYSQPEPPPRSSKRSRKPKERFDDMEDQPRRKKRMAANHIVGDRQQASSKPPVAATAEELQLVPWSDGKEDDNSMQRLFVLQHDFFKIFLGIPENWCRPHMAMQNFTQQLSASTSVAALRTLIHKFESSVCWSFKKVSFDHAMWRSKLEDATALEHLHECLNDLEYLCFPISTSGPEEPKPDATVGTQVHVQCSGEHLVWVPHGRLTWPARIVCVNVFTGKVKVDFFGEASFVESSIENIQPFSLGFMHLCKQSTSKSFRAAVTASLTAYAECYGKSWAQMADLFCDGSMARINEFVACASVLE